MKPSAIFAKALLLGGLAFGLAACDGKEDFSDIGRGDCPIGGNCRVEARGDLLVELSGPIVGGLGYVCSGSVEYIKLEESTNRNDELIPAGMAACPTDAKDITFYLGRATDGSHHIELGKAYIPAIGRATLHSGSEREIVRLTWADVIKSPRRMDSGSLGNRLLLLAKLDNGNADGEFTQPPVSFPRCVNDALDIYLASFEEGSTEKTKTLTAEIDAESVELDEWDAFLTALKNGEINDLDTGENICEDFDVPSTNLSEDDLKEALSFAMNATRAGALALSYQDESLLAHLVSEKVELAPNPKMLGQISGNVLVFPDGSVRGFPAATLFERDEDRAQEGEILRDILYVDQDPSNPSKALSDQLELRLKLKGLQVDPPKFLQEKDDDASWVYLPVSDLPPTNIDVIGIFLGSAVFDGVVWEPEEVKLHDGQLVYPQLPDAQQVQDGEKGRFGGDFLGKLVEDLLVNDGQTKAPIRAVRVSYGSTQMHRSVVNELMGKEFALQLMRACTDDDDVNSCESITEKDAENYPTEVQYDSGLSVGQGGDNTNTETIKVPVYESHTSLMDELSMTLVERDGHLYITHDGNDVGYISHTEIYTEEGSTHAESAIFTMIFDQRSLLDNDDAFQYLYGMEIQGRLDLRSCEADQNQFYRLSDDSFKAGLTAGWIGNYWALKSLEDVDTATNEALVPKLIYAQGSARLSPVTCP